jgi:hypothetical protein
MSRWSRVYVPEIETGRHVKNNACAVEIKIKWMIRKDMTYENTLKFNFDHSPKAINSLITQSACIYLDLLPRVKRMLTEIYAGKQYFIIL